MPPPSTQGGNGARDARGRFLPGNRTGRGNPFAGQAAKLRAEMFAAVTPARLRKIVQAVIRQAENGDLVAAKLVFERTLGPPVAADLLERLEKIEESLSIESEQR